MKQLDILLIANCGEVAVRIVRACLVLGICMLATYSSDLFRSGHVGMKSSPSVRWRLGKSVLQNVLAQPVFQRGEATTNFIEIEMANE